MNYRKKIKNSEDMNAKEASKFFKAIKDLNRGKFSSVKKALEYPKAVYNTMNSSLALPCNTLEDKIFPNV